MTEEQRIREWMEENRVGCGKIGSVWVVWDIDRHGPDGPTEPFGHPHSLSRESALRYYADFRHIPIWQP